MDSDTAGDNFPGDWKMLNSRSFKGVRVLREVTMDGVSRLRRLEATGVLDDKIRHSL